MKEIPLTRGKVALVDDADFEALAKYKWQAKRDKKTWYVYRRARKSDGEKGLMSMHRQIMVAGPGREVDHKDGDGLNNQRDNLRLCSHAQNMCNHQHKTDGCSSLYKGVCWRKDVARWVAKIRVSRRLIHLGLFDSQEDAAQAYNQAAKQYFGEFAALNEIDERGGVSCL